MVSKQSPKKDSRRDLRDVPRERYSHTYARVATRTEVEHALAGGMSERLVRLGHLQIEKCELGGASETFRAALREARNESNHRATAEALVGLLRVAGEALNDEEVAHWDAEIDRLMQKLRRSPPGECSPLVWYGKGAIATFRKEWAVAQRYFHRYLHEVRKDTGVHLRDRQEAEARALAMLCNALMQRGKLGRARWLAHEILRRYETLKLRSVNGVLYLLVGNILENEGNLDAALQWFQKAHAAFLEEHNWYHHLYVLYGYARIARVQRNYGQARWYLDLIDKATGASNGRNEFAVLRREILREKELLDSDSVDLLVDPNAGTVHTREASSISIRKQYVLLEILKALSEAHNRSKKEADGGLSKGAIIESVWKERYRPEAHDNKLYYNINRLRKLIEPDARHPRYLLNWKEGYRLAPGLRVEFAPNAKPGGTQESRPAGGGK